MSRRHGYKRGAAAPMKVSRGGCHLGRNMAAVLLSCALGWLSPCAQRFVHFSGVH